MYGVRKISKNEKIDKSLIIGTEITAHGWRKYSPKKKFGLYCFINIHRALHTLEGDYWVVLEFDEKDIILVDGYRCRINKGKIVFLSKNPAGILQFFDYEKFDSRMAYYWSRDFGDQDIMIDKIKESMWAYKWAKDIGNQDVMIDRITEPFWSQIFHNQRIAKYLPDF